MLVSKHPLCRRLLLFAWLHRRNRSRAHGRPVINRSGNELASAAEKQQQLQYTQSLITPFYRPSSGIITLASNGNGCAKSARRCRYRLSLAPKPSTQVSVVADDPRDALRHGRCIVNKGSVCDKL